MQRVTSRQNAVVGRYRAVAHGDEPALLLLDGTHLVADALLCGIEIHHLVVAADAAHDPEVGPLLERASARGIAVALASAPVMAAVSPVRSTSPIAGLATKPTRAGRMFDTDAPFVVVACGVQDPGNLGAMVRVAEAAGASGLLAAGAGADPFSWKALRGSMGSALRLPIGVRPRVEDAVADLRRHHCRLFAMVPREGTTVFDADLRGPIAVLIGGEGPGLASDVTALADERITIPMQPPVESLNAAVSLALVAYEARRQRA